jgi:hypothetical protein
MRAGFQQMDIDEPNNTDNILNALGFEDGELEMFFDMNSDSDVSSEQLIQQLIQRYLEIAREEPFNLDWQSVQNAIVSPYQTSAIKPNGTPFTKHDIAKDVLDSFDDDMQQGGYKRRKSKTRTRKTKKSRTRKTKKSKRRRTRRH